MKILVQKFGGTSVADEQSWQRLALKVSQALGQGYSPVVVVSAMGRFPAPYATDTLLSLVKEWTGQGEQRELDMLMACGEIISSVVIAHYLRAHGLPAQAFSGAQAGIRSQGPFGAARVSRIDPAALLEAVAQGRIPVVAGFQSQDEEHSEQLATLGRGGSDTTAVALGAALGAETVIYTDVNGVMTADPRVVPQAQVIGEVTHLEIGEMANEGAKVLHPRSVALARAHAVPLAVRSTFVNDQEEPGTSIVAGEGFRAVRIADAHQGELRPVTGVVSVGGLCTFSVDFSLVNNVPVARLKIMQALAKASLSLDMIDLVSNRLYFLVKGADLWRAKQLVEECGCGFALRNKCGKVSVVGAGMRGVPGIMLRIYEALNRSKVELIYSTDSHITISCVVPEDQLTKASQALHTEFGLDKDRGGN